MSEYNDLSEFLESDSEAMDFYNSLPIGLQQRMYKCGVDVFKRLYECEKSYNPKAKDRRGCMMSAASVNECTGLIRSGSDKSLEQWSEYSNLEPFGVPHFE